MFPRIGYVGTAKRRSWVAAVLLLALGVGVSVACMLTATSSVQKLEAYVQWIAEKFSQEGPVQTLKTSWQYQTSSGGVATKCIETTRLPDEDEQAWDDRHEAAVTAAQASCPPIEDD